MPIPTTEALRERIVAFDNHYRLAQASGVPRSTIQSIASGKVADPGMQTARSIIEALDTLDAERAAREVAP